MQYLIFKTKQSYAKSLDSSDDTTWTRFQLEWTPELVAPFNHILQPDPVLQLEQAITRNAEKSDETDRLELYKSLMKSSVFIPISDDAMNLNHNYLVFPQENDRSFLCTFTSSDTLSSVLGKDVHFKSISCSSLFRLIQNRDISAVVITNSNQDNVVIDSSEFSLLSFATNINQLNYTETVRSLASILLKDPDISSDHPSLND